ncbi:MAG: alpha/beta fold hydrolase, partial [Acidimicrobiales bacterium]
MLLDGFSARPVDVGGVEIATWTLGDGPPLLLLHGYPQTHHLWHRVAPALAERFTVVATDLRGYGASAKPPGGEDHA